jgi:drug/metabolite transporter (DMT)-like permease
MIKVAVEEIPPVTMVFGRITVGAAALAIFVRMKKLKLPRDLATWKQFAVMGVFNIIIPFWIIGWAETVIPTGLAGVLNATVPLWAVVILHFLPNGERANWMRALGTALGFAGVALLIGWSAAEESAIEIAAQIGMLIATLCYAGASTYGRRFAGHPAYIAALGQLIATSALLLPLSLIVDRPWTLPAPSLAAISCIVAMGVFSTALAYILYFSILRAAGTLNIVLVTFLIPIGALFWGVTLLDETLKLSVIPALALIGAGLAFIDGRLIRRSSNHPD